MGRTISNGSDPYRYSKSSQQSGGGLCGSVKASFAGSTVGAYVYTLRLHVPI